jgi:hypothetical protein
MEEHNLVVDNKLVAGTVVVVGIVAVVVDIVVVVGIVDLVNRIYSQRVAGLFVVVVVRDSIMILLKEDYRP